MSIALVLYRVPVSTSCYQFTMKLSTITVSLLACLAAAAPVDSLNKRDNEQVCTGDREPWGCTEVNGVPGIWQSYGSGDNIRWYNIYKPWLPYGVRWANL
ncbi:uncharacterized protein YALI1_E28224g [Yarrowia lipolytica]|uniref:Uncharacterized protein n=1 Tax=Yarrowia lipolytica TaxID=4952 RepID=A0A1D8NJR7_YARLL|nr:hypothetical protein YALI1_E28224g [Yarrowia lipolytica]